MEQLMRYETFGGKAWWHRAIVGMAMALIAISTVAATTSPKTRPYSLTFNITLPSAYQMTFDATVVDNATNEVLTQPRLTTQSGVRGEVTSKLQDGREINMRMRGRTPGEAEILLEVKEHGKLVQRTLYTRSERTYDGEPISINLKDAEIRDVLNTLGDLTGLTFEIAPDVEGSITMDVRDVPWDKMLDDMLNDHGLAGEIDGKTIRVSRKK
jgi:hypothetical protein